MRRRRDPAARMLAALAGGGFACCFFAALALAAGPSPGKLKSIERSIERSEAEEAALARKAAQLQEEAQKLRHRAVAVAARAREHEATLNALEGRIDALAAREATVLASLDKRRGQLILLIAALERIARNPPIALIALPASPADTVRSALLLRDAVPEVEERARALRRDLESLAELREGMASARTKLEAERQALEEERHTLAALGEEKARLAGRTEAERQAAHARSQKLAGEARDLRELLARIAESRKREADRAAPAPEPAPRQELAALPPATDTALAAALPAAGAIVRHFGDAAAAGQPAQGVSIRTRAGATVVAPRDGTVVFAGPFQGLGQLLIIQYRAEYHLLLAGLSRIDAVAGDKVIAGEPVGSMDASEDAKPTLYMELRRKGRPVNPLPWLAAGRTRVNG